MGGARGGGDGSLQSYFWGTFGLQNQEQGRNLGPRA